MANEFNDYDISLLSILQRESTKLEEKSFQPIKAKIVYFRSEIQGTMIDEDIKKWKRLLKRIEAFESETRN